LHLAGTHLQHNTMDEQEGNTTQYLGGDPHIRAQFGLD
jgi:hypothetical protein